MRQWALAMCVWLGLLEVCLTASPGCTSCMTFTGLSVITLVPGPVPTRLTEAYAHLHTIRNFSCSANDSRVDSRGHEWCVLAEPDTGKEVSVALDPASNLAFVAMFKDALPYPRDKLADNTRCPSMDFQVRLVRQQRVGGAVWENDLMPTTVTMVAFVINEDMARLFGAWHGATGFLYVLNTSMPTNDGANSTRLLVYADEASFLRTRLTSPGLQLIPAFAAPSFVIDINPRVHQEPDVHGKSPDLGPVNIPAMLISLFLTAGIFAIIWCLTTGGKGTRVETTPLLRPIPIPIPTPSKRDTLNGPPTQVLATSPSPADVHVSADGTSFHMRLVHRVEEGEDAGGFVQGHPEHTS